MVAHRQGKRLRANLSSAERNILTLHTPQRILVTGAGGYIGAALVRRLVQNASHLHIAQITALDINLQGAVLPEYPLLRKINGSLRDAETRALALAEAPDLVFHLAGITSGQAEQQFEASFDVNVVATMALFEDLRRLGNAPRLVQTSSIGVFGLPLPARIDDQTLPTPTLTYGAHKLMMETLLADYSRRGWIDGRSVRLPSVVARPAGPNGASSSFASDLIRELCAGRPYDCPIDAGGTIWLLSLTACIDALLHAARIDAAQLPRTRAWTLPALRASAAQVVDAISSLYGNETVERIRYCPDPALLAQFARWPQLDTSLAESQGFVADKSLPQLLARTQRALQGDIA